MRRRRAQGLPGLAVGWGAIADAGVLTRDADTAERLERISGIAAMQARDALAHLGTLLARGTACPSTVYCASLRPSAAMQGLKLQRTPYLAPLFAALDADGQEAEIDLATQIAGKSETEARAIVARLVAGEVARIFRLSAEEIECGRPLDQLGMDSMMSIDLRMGIEKRFGIEMPVVAISVGVSVNDLATRILAGLRAGPQAAPADTVESQLLQQHGPSGIDLAELMAMTETIRERDNAVALL
jgi:acyl carrier protein